MTTVSIKHYIYVICRPGGPYWEKLWCLCFFSLENYFIRNSFVDFLLQQFHTVRVRWTFRSSKPALFTEVFKRRDSVFAHISLCSWREWVRARNFCGESANSRNFRERRSRKRNSTRLLPILLATSAVFALAFGTEVRAGTHSRRLRRLRSY